jgi:hypothetical protein
MTELLGFCERHPVWSLLALALIAGGIRDTVRAWREFD